MGLVLILAGIAATAAGYARFRVPWGKYQALKLQEANIARYESWRGGLRDTGPTGASVAMEMLRKQARDSAVIMAAGIAVVILGFFVS
jgi:hypothetical protein